MKFVIGFVFDSTLKKVLMIRKNRPERFFGLYNGIGGKVEEDETFDKAMEREADEEAGISGLTWHRGPKIEGSNKSYFIRFYYAVMPGPLIYCQKTDEELFTFDLELINWTEVIQPVQWAIDCCLYDLRRS